MVRDAEGVCLTANPPYLPVAVGEPDRAYTHTVRSVSGGSPIGPDSPVDPAADDDSDAVVAGVAVGLRGRPGGA